MKHKRLTTDEASEALRCNRKTLYRWIREGRIPATRFGHRWLIDRDAIEKASRTNGSQPQRRRNNAGRDSLRKFGV